MSTSLLEHLHNKYIKAKLFIFYILLALHSLPRLRLLQNRMSILLFSHNFSFSLTPPHPIHHLIQTPYFENKVRISPLFLPALQPLNYVLTTWQSASIFLKDILFIWLSRVSAAALRNQCPDQGWNPSPLHPELRAPSHWTTSGVPIC